MRKGLRRKVLFVLRRGPRRAHQKQDRLIIHANSHRR